MQIGDIIYGVLFEPGQTFSRLGFERERAGLAALVFIGVFIVDHISAQAISIHKPSVIAVPAFVTGWFWGLKLVFSGLFLLTMSGIISILGECFYQKSNGLGLLIALGFTVLPLVFGAPVHYALILIGFPALGMVFSALAILWVIVLQIISIKAAMELDTVPAIALYFSPVIILGLAGIMILFTGLVFGRLFS